MNIIITIDLAEIIIWCIWFVFPFPELLIILNTDFCFVLYTCIYHWSCICFFVFVFCFVFWAAVVPYITLYICFVLFICICLFSCICICFCLLFCFLGGGCAIFHRGILPRPIDPLIKWSKDLLEWNKSEIPGDLFRDKSWIFLFVHRF